MLPTNIRNLFRRPLELQHESDVSAVIAICEADRVAVTRGRATCVSQSKMVLCCSRPIRPRTNLRVEVVKALVFGRVKECRHVGLHNFEIVVQVDRVVMASIPVTPVRNRRTAHAAATTPDARVDRERFEILLVDSRSTDVGVVELLLESTGLNYHLIAARNGTQALERLLDPSRPQPALILLDMDVPSIGGLAFLEKIKSEPLVKSSAVAVLSSSATDPDVRRANELGAVAYFRKPRYFEEYEFLSLRMGKLLTGLMQQPARVSEAGAA